jgi:hypothetical protein
MKKTRIERTKKGYPAFWEAGGSSTNTGEATIIANKDGQPKKAIYVRRRGQLANSYHALVFLEVGDYIIEANHHREDFEIQIFRILDFEVKYIEMYEERYEETYAIMKQVSCYSMGEWDAELPTFLAAAVQAAMEKATCYHCREPHFIIAE